MSYGTFLAVFLLPPLLLVALAVRRAVTRSVIALLAVLAAVAIVYTGPWDSAIIANGVWSYGPRQVSGVVIARVPLEEYGFYVLQVALTGLFTVLLLARRGR